MSKLKSRFRPKVKEPLKPSAPQIWYVDIYESEADWGVRRDERLEFPSEAKAIEYAQKFNEESATYATEQHFFSAFVYVPKSIQKPSLK